MPQTFWETSSSVPGPPPLFQQKSQQQQCRVCSEKSRFASSHSRARKLKKAPAKQLVKSNKSISQKTFLTKFHFLQFQKWPKINFCTGKKFKTAKNAISRGFLPGRF